MISAELRAQQRRMPVHAPLVETQQDRAIGIANLAEVGVGWWRLRLAEEQLVPPDAARHVADADDRPRALHDASEAGGFRTS